MPSVNDHLNIIIALEAKEATPTDAESVSEPAKGITSPLLLSYASLFVDFSHSVHSPLSFLSTCKK